MLWRELRTGAFLEWLSSKQAITGLERKRVCFAVSVVHDNLTLEFIHGSLPGCWEDDYR